MISKKLLGEVLGIDVIDFEIVSFPEESDKDFDPCLRINYNEIDTEYVDCMLLLNIYELAHRCKKWAYAKDYAIYTGLDDLEIWFDGIEIKQTIKFNTEPEAIFKACEWILENKDKE